jgi:hypothetical protein
MRRPPVGSQLLFLEHALDEATDRCFSPLRTRSTTPPTRPSGWRAARTTNVTLLGIASAVGSSTPRIMTRRRHSAVISDREKIVKGVARQACSSLGTALRFFRAVGHDTLRRASPG